MLPAVAGPSATIGAGAAEQIRLDHRDLEPRFPLAKVTPIPALPPPRITTSASIWGGRIVSESTLASRINAARHIIGDSGEQQRLIRTNIGKGVRFVGAVQEPQAPAEPAISIPPRLSIIVLPFTNLSNDPELEFFADGITDDLTTDLSQTPDSFVIARNTAH